MPVSLDQRSDACERPTICNYQANIDFTPSSSGAGNSLTLGVFGGYVHVQPTGGGVSDADADAGANRRGATAGPRRHRSCTRTTSGSACCRRRRSASRCSGSRQAPYLDYPTGTVRVGVAAARRHDVDQNLSIRWRRSRRARCRIWPSQLTNQLQWFSDDNKHTHQGDVEPLARAQHHRRRARRSARSRSIRSPISRRACRPPSRARCRRFTCRAISSRRACRSATRGVRRARCRCSTACAPTATAFSSGPTSTPRCATRSASATTSCRIASTSARASACSGRTAPRRRSRTRRARRVRRSR